MRIPRLKTLGLALAALTVATLHAQPASAGPAPASEPQPEPCVSLALSRGADLWTCNAEGIMEVEVDDQTGEPQPPVYTPIPQPVVQVGPSPSDAGTMDDWDTWCETGSICRRPISRWINETKGNTAYGNRSGVIGTYDLIIRTNFSGRQPRHDLSLIWDTGPSIDFNDVYIRCREDRNNLPDLNCGDHFVGGPTIGPAYFRWNAGTTYGNRLANSNPYYADVTAEFWPTGYPMYTAAPLRTQKWYCPPDVGSDTSCYFP
ncbi:hypothetical protein [Micromonospora inyonensis]|uniref:Secreted protein n=1 Tax=Micromonospora inyonensis TaxID=47866 RepID=A0A1C6SC54_9ACTN|nr:hypothetical protein [Micromonospora inyonensis]SCL26922.1 hypothetical protein GA0074694_4658 [Micromonospora inyonensis]